MANVVGVPLIDSLTFRDTADAIVTGKVDGDFTKVAYLISAPATTVPVTISTDSVIPGQYPLSFTPSIVGHWKVLISCAHGSPAYTYRWEETFEVLTAAQDDPLTALVSSYAAGTVGALLANLGFLGGESFLVEAASLFAVRGTVLLVPTVDGVIEMLP